MHIYIPTLARADKQITLANLTPRLLEKTTLVVNHNERVAYKGVSERYGVQLLVCPPTVTTIGDARQHIVDKHDVKQLGPTILMLDDDLRFFSRRIDDKTKFLPVNSGTLETCMIVLGRLMVNYAHGGILAREGGNRMVTPLVTNTRLLRALAYNVEVMRKHRVRFDRQIVMEDFDVALQLLRLGYKSVALCSYVQDQGTSNAPGGCSTYRTLQRQAEGAKALHRHHPDFVKLVQKTTTTAWGGATRTDVIVSWKKAYQSSQR